HRPRILPRPLPRAGVVRVGPRQDLFDRQTRQPLAVPLTPPFRQQLRQGRGAGQPPAAPDQGLVDGPPRLAGGGRNPSPPGSRPAAGAPVVCIGPGQDLRFAQRLALPPRHRAPLCRRKRSQPRMPYLPLGAGRTNSISALSLCFLTSWRTLTRTGRRWPSLVG